MAAVLERQTLGCMLEKENSIMYAVIMAAARNPLLALSREKMPKQLLKIGSNDTLIQRPSTGCFPLMKREHIFIVTNQGLAVDIGRNSHPSSAATGTGTSSWSRKRRTPPPALGLSALHLSRFDPDGIMVVLSGGPRDTECQGLPGMPCRRLKGRTAQDYLVDPWHQTSRPRPAMDTSRPAVRAGETGLDGNFPGRACRRKARSEDRAGLFCKAASISGTAACSSGKCARS